jgi:hypothetical protein
MKYEFLLKALLVSGLAASPVMLACSAESSDPYPGNNGNRTGSGATAGTAGTVGTGGTAGNPTGTGGNPTGTGGNPTGTGGVAGTGTAGTGTAGTGTAGTGAGGTAGGGACMTVVGSATDLPITNLESGSNAIDMPRTGYWYTYGDGTGIMPPPDPSGANPFAPAASGNGGSAYYAHFTCTGGKNVGMGFDLNNCGSKPNPYDVTAYTGISFAYKSSHDLKVSLASVVTTPSPNGTCVGADTCNNHHFAVLPAAAAWTTASVPFTMLTQDFGTITPIASVKNQVLQIQFQVSGVWNAEAMAQDPITPTAVDFGVDDIAFTVN